MLVRPFKDVNNKESESEHEDDIFVNPNKRHVQVDSDSDDPSCGSIAKLGELCGDCFVRSAQAAGVSRSEPMNTVDDPCGRPLLVVDTYYWRLPPTSSP